MRAVAYCCLDFVENSSHTIQEVFVMPGDGLAIRHISSPCASCNSPLAKAVCYAIANKQNEFMIGERKYFLMNCRVYDHDYIGEYKESPLINLIPESKKVFTIHVYEGRTSCSLNKHKAKDMRAVIMNMKDNKPAMINVFYCSMCDKYWLHKSALLDYQKHGIFPSVRFRYYDPWGVDDSGMQRQSTLKQYGYNVQAGGMPEGERRRLLASLIYNGLLTRREIVEHLWFCLDMPGSRPNMQNACEKWSNDLRFVQGLPVHDKEAIYGYLAGL